VQKHISILVSCESVSSGRSSREVKDLDVTSVIKSLYYYSGSAGLNNEYEANYEPLGVVAVCSYYDSSLLSLVNKLAPALVTGNACLLVPHRLNVLSAYMFLDICVQSGLPRGVLNLVLSSNYFFFTI
jgi:aldehyde dehydrogenase (NAD+)